MADYEGRWGDLDSVYEAAGDAIEEFVGKPNRSVATVPVNAALDLLATDPRGKSSKKSLARRVRHQARKLARQGERIAEAKAERDAAYDLIRTLHAGLAYEMTHGGLRSDELELLDRIVEHNNSFSSPSEADR